MKRPERFLLLLFLAREGIEISRWFGLELEGPTRVDSTRSRKLAASENGVCQGIAVGFWRSIWEVVESVCPRNRYPSFFPSIELPSIDRRSRRKKIIVEK